MAFIENCTPPTLPLPSDKDIENNARMALASHPDIYSLNVDILVENGRVRLEGTVDAYWKRWRAGEIMSELRGVVDVANHLTVVPTASFLDKDIATDIEAALERNIYVDAKKVIVKVAHGKATLTGTLPTNYARNRAYESAAFTSGVIEVENGIIVSLYTLRQTSALGFRWGFLAFQFIPSVINDLCETGKLQFDSSIIN